MSRAEEITSEVRKLVLTCRTLEAQVQQSVPKKTHQEVIAKMQTSVDEISAELARTKAELEKTTSLGERINSLSNQLSTQNETMAAQSKTIDALTTRLAQNTVPALLYSQSLSRIQELEEKVQCMIDRSEYVSLQKRLEELSERMASMIPRSQYQSLQAEFSNYVPKTKFEELQTRISSMVPREVYEALQARTLELETKLVNTVPRNDYDELMARITSLTREASNPMSIETAVQSSILSVDRPISESLDFAEKIVDLPKEEIHIPQPSIQQEAVTTRVTLESNSPEKVTESVAAPEPVSSEVKENLTKEVGDLAAPVEGSSPTTHAPEITEVQSQLSEISGNANSEQNSIGSSSSEVSPVTQGFAFAGTSYCATNGVEFLDDLERIPVETLETHTKNGDFERWFKDVLSDNASADSLRATREANFTGEELRARTIAVIAPRYGAILS